MLIISRSASLGNRPHMEFHRALLGSIYYHICILNIENKIIKFVCGKHLEKIVNKINEGIKFQTDFYKLTED